MPAALTALAVTFAGTAALPSLADPAPHTVEVAPRAGQNGVVTVLQIDADPAVSSPAFDGLPGDAVGPGGLVGVVDTADGRAVLDADLVRDAELAGGDTVRVDAVATRPASGEDVPVVTAATLLDAAPTPAGVGVRNVSVFPIYWAEPAAPSSPTHAELTATVNDMAAYLEAATRGQGSVVVRQVHPWTKIEMPDGASCRVVSREVERALLDLGKDLPRLPTEHLIGYFPQAPACSWGGLATIGSHVSGRGLMWMNGLLTSRSWSHEIGHNLGLHHSGGLSCQDEQGREVTLSDTCQQREYADPWDLMGNHPHERVGSINAEHQRQLGLLSEGQTRRLPTSERVTLAPVSQGSGLLGAEIDMGAQHLFLEWRPAAGLDSWVHDLRYVDPDGNEVIAPGDGLVLRLRDARTPLRQVLTTLETDPDGFLDSPRLSRPALGPGEWWLSPDHEFGARVAAVGTEGATVDVVVPGSDATGDRSRRVFGQNRFETSVAVSRARWAPGVDRVYLANGVEYADALTSGPAGVRDDAPVLLVQRDRVPGAVAAELQRLAPREIVLVGGTGAVGEPVARTAREVAGSVLRWGGTDRFETAEEVSRNTRAPGTPVVYVASGRDFPDALAAAPAAGDAGAPVLLTDTHRVPRVILEELQRLGPERVVVVGGVTAITPETVAEIAATPGVGTVERVSGDQRFATAAHISERRFPDGAGTVYLASGLAFPDAVSVAPLAGLEDGPVLLTQDSRLPQDTLAEVLRLDPERVVVLGAEGAIGHPVYNRVAMEVD